MGRKMALVIGLVVLLPMGLSHAKFSTELSLIEKCMQLKHGLMIKCINEGADALKPLIQDNKKPDWQAPQEMTVLKNPYKADEESIEKGAKFFRQYCSGCHGMTGKGDGEGWKDSGIQIADLTISKTDARTDGELMHKITDGGWPMPAFGYQQEWSREDLWHVINFIRSLSKDSPNVK